MTVLMEELDLEMENFQPLPLSAKSGILNKLKEMNLLKYGVVISESDVSFVMGEEKDFLNTERWNLTLMHFREIVKGEGFYISSRGRHNELYILEPHEMPLYNDKKNKAVLRNLKQRQRGLHIINESLLSDEHRKKLEFEILRNASFEIEMATKLKERCR
jgi:hypothetical protein